MTDEKNQNTFELFVELMDSPPILSIICFIFAVLVIIISLQRWYLDDLSQLIFGLAIGFGIFYVGYDQWFKRKVIHGMSNDVRKVDGRVERLENKIIELNGKIH